MRKYLKTILCSVVFSFIIALSLSGSAAGTGEDYGSLTVQLGVVDSSLAKSDEPLTRGEFCVLVTDLMTWNGLGTVPPATRQIFNDVAQWDWVSANLEFLYERNIVRGYDDYTFRPNEKIELAPAYHMLLRLLGYEVYIAANGDYPDAVMKTAAMSGLSDGVSGGYDAPVTGKMAVRMLDNLLDIEVVEVAGATGSNLIFKNGDIFLNDYFDIYEYKGVITGVEGLSITGNKVAAGNIEIDGEIYTNAAAGAEDMLGYEVSYYIMMRDGTEGEIMAVVPKRTNSTVEIESKDIISYENRRIKYEDGKRVKTVDVSGIADIIINGVARTENDVFVPDYGSIKLIDNDGDRKYDVVLISDYDTIIVETVDTSRSIIYGQNTDKNGNKYVIEVDKYGYVGIFNSSGKRIELANIAAGSVITAEISDAEYLKMHYSELSVTGEIKVLNYNGKTQELTVDGTLYDTVGNIYTKGGSLSVGAAGSFLMDFKGNIAAAILDKSETWSFGYMMKAYINDGDEAVSLKLLTEEGSVKHISCTSNLKIDSAQITNPAYAAEILMKPQLIRYRMKQDNISMIDLAKDQPMADFTFTAGDNNNALLRRAYAPMQYTQNVNTFKQRTWNSSITTMPQEDVVDGEGYLTENTVIFQVPADAQRANDSDYKVIAKSSISANRQCDVESFNTSPEEFKAEAVVLHDEDTVISSAARLFVVEKVIEAVGTDGDITYELRGWYSGAQATRTLKKADLIKVGSHRITKGDIIRTKQDSAGLTTNIELIYSADGTEGNLATTNPWSPPIVGAVGFGAEMRCLTGTVLKKNDTLIIIEYGAAKHEIMDIKSSTIYVMNVNSTSKNDFMYIGTSGDIREGDKFVMSTRTGSPTEIIFINQ